MKTFIIYLKDREHSVRQANQMFKTLTEYGHDVEYFDGIPGDIALDMAREEKRKPYPFSIKSESVSLDDLKKYVVPHLWKEFSEKFNIKAYEKIFYSAEELEKISRPGVIGCFYSHYLLWQR